MENGILPVQRHKKFDIPQNEKAVCTRAGMLSNINAPGSYIPHDLPCLSQSMYGTDYMTPESGKSS